MVLSWCYFSLFLFLLLLLLFLLLIISLLSFTDNCAQQFKSLNSNENLKNFPTNMKVFIDKVDAVFYEPDHGVF